MTSTRSLPAQSEDASTPKPKRLGLSWTQIAAAGFASITATVILSFFSISGTLIGAAVFSMASAVGNAVYGQSLRKTQDKVLDVLPVGRADPASPTVVLPASVPTPDAVDEELPTLPAPASVGTFSPPAWKRVALFAVVIFAFVMAVVTTVELVAGRPLTDVLRGESGSGTSIGGGGRAPAPTVTVTVTPKVVTTTPTVTQTAPPATTTTTPPATTAAPSTGATGTTSTTAPAAPSGSGSASGSASGSGSGSGSGTPGPSQSSSR